MKIEDTLHVRVYCPSCGNEVVLGAYRASLDVDLNLMSVEGSFRGGHECSPREPSGIFEIRGDVDEETAGRLREMLQGFRGRKG